MRLQVFITVAVVVVLTVLESVTASCGQATIYRNSNITCPARAICADRFKISRNWQNGTTCEESRVLNNCFCPSSYGGPSTPCPIDDSHKLRGSTRQEIYTCEPKCDLPWCDSGRVPSMHRHIQSRAFNNRNFYQIDCRCPGHHFLNTQVSGLYRSTVPMRASGYQRMRGILPYSCRRGSSNNVADPCLN